MSPIEEVKTCQLRKGLIIRFEDSTYPEFLSSIHQHGITTPLVVTKIKGTSNVFKVLDGNRRLRAALELGIETLPVKCV